MPVLTKGQKPPRTLPNRGDRPARFVGRNIEAASADPGFAGLTSEADLNGIKNLGEKTKFEEAPKPVVGLPKPVDKKPKKPKPTAAKKVAKKKESNG